MGLRADAAQDLIDIHTDTDDFGWDITVVDPDGVTADLVGLSTDIGEDIDPDTGAFISNRVASVSIPIESLTDAGMSIPRGIQDSSQRPWQIVFNSITGTQYTFKVTATRPDNALGSVVCMLEKYIGS